MRVWMIHEVTKEETEILKTLPTKDLLIWDDAVLSQFDAILDMPEHRHILAVSTNVANYASQQTNLSPIFYEPTSASHKRWHEERIATPFMSWDKIKFLLSQCNNLTVAAHGYNHTRPIKDIRVGVKEFLDDCYKIERDFLNNLSFKPEIYVYPYNDAPFWSDAVIKKHFGWMPFGKGRLDAKKLFSGEIKLNEV
jgi:hypothetical protein